MSRKKKVVDKSKIAERMKTYMMLMGYNGDYQLTVAKELGRRVWKRSGKLSKKRIRRLQYLLCSVDSATLLGFTVSIGKLVWSDSFLVKRRLFEKKLSEKVRWRSAKKMARRGRLRRVRVRRRGSVVKKQKGRNGNGVLLKFVTGFRMRPVLGSVFKMVVRHKVSRKHAKPQFGGLLYRLAMAMNVLCYRNVLITSEWEFWTLCFVQRICGFWKSVAFADGLSDSYVKMAKDLRLYVVSSELLERMESSAACSSSPRYPGSRLAE